MPSYRKVAGRLANANFPFISNFHGRTVVVSQLDMNPVREVPTEGERGGNVPQVFYMHNCLPTGSGYQSIGFENVIPPISPAATDFDEVFVLRNDAELKVLFSPAQGKNYIYNPNDGVWVSTNPLDPGTVDANTTVTVATVQGRTLIFYKNLAAYEYDFATKVLSQVTLTGLVSTALLGVCASNNYLITYTETTVYWSDPTNIVDFTPSLTTGAGSSIPNDIKGKIVACLPVNNGFIIYTTQNALLASYTGNVRFPWQFREIANSSGIASTADVGWQANLTFHYAWTGGGMMKVDRTLADHQFPDITDFVSSRIFEDFDEVTEVFTTEYLNTRMQTKVAFIGSRYLVFSYGRFSLTHALVYDSAQKRWGKLKIDHVDCFEYPSLPFYDIRTYEDLMELTYEDLDDTTYAGLDSEQNISVEPRHGFAFLQADGTVKLVNVEFNYAESAGVLIIGKYQFVRNNICRIDGLVVENLIEPDDMTVKIFSSWNGKGFNVTTTLGYQTNDSMASTYPCRIKAMNHSVYFRGRFNLVSFLLTLQNGGLR